MNNAPTMNTLINAIKSRFGAHVSNMPSDAALLREARISQSPNFVQGRAINHTYNTPYEGSMSSLMWNFFVNRSALKPSQRLPHQKPDFAALATPSKDLRVTWLGHSSLFVELSETRILIDPVFDYASPWIAQKWFNRNLDAPATRKELPQPDVIVISHDHYDHLEKKTIKHFKNTNVRFFVPLGVGAHLEKWGVDPAKITEFDWWESQQLNGITFTAAPANHNSGRTGFDGNRTLFASWSIKSDDGSMFYSGDSAYGAHFKQIGQRLGPFDVSFIEVAANVKESGGYPVENWGHMQASHTMQAHKDVQANKLFPVHWSTYELFAHVWDEPINDLIEEANIHNALLVSAMPGESFYPQTHTRFSHWWQQAELEFAQAHS